MINWMDYGKIQEHKRNGLKKSQVAKRLADEYKDYVVECLKKYQDMSAAQIYDWIKEQTCLESLYFQKRAFRNYVQEIRKEYR